MIEIKRFADKTILEINGIKKIVENKQFSINQDIEGKFEILALDGHETTGDDDFMFIKFALYGRNQ